MATAKEEALQLISGLPDDCTLEEIQYQLDVREKVERGLRDVEQGRTISQDEMDQTVVWW